VFGAIEAILFAWVFGMGNAWDEIHRGADMRIPGFYKFIIKYITPLFLLSILGVWFWQEWRPVITMANISAADRPFVLATRAGLLAVFFLLGVMVKISWLNKKEQRGNAS
jgi:hypothetical protein